jgi:P4 family phage/plasmid primase-like protien
MPQIKSTNFKEPINLTKLKHIAANPKIYRSKIEAEEKERKKTISGKHYDSTFTILEKLVKKCEVPPEYQGTEMGVLNVYYLKGKNSREMGRFYCKDGIGLQSLVNSVRHTICEGIWTDIDMVNAHPVLLQQLLKKYNLNSPMLDECVNYRERFLLKVCDNRASAKRKIISVINGASYEKHKLLHQFSKEIRPLITKIVYHEDWIDTTDYVRQTYNSLGESKIIDKSISRILQVIENDILEHYLNWAYHKGFIDKTTNNVALIFDGFQILNKFNISNDDLDECQKYAFEKTGYNIELKIKHFDNCIELPDDYADSFVVCFELVNRYMSYIDKIVKDNINIIELIVCSDSCHSSIAILAFKIFGCDFYYDDKQKTWYYCNYNNIWCDTTEPDLLKYLIQTIIKSILMCYNLDYIHKRIGEFHDANAKENITDTDKKVNDTYIAVLEEREKKCLKIATDLGNWSFTSKVFENSKVSFCKSDFFKDYIDSKHHLFAFKNKVYDFRKNEIRPITRDDYIMNTTGYKYPENVKEEDTAFIINYFKTLFPNEDMFNYLLDTCCSTLNGEKKEQYFNIHTGCGSNSKSTFSGLFETILGGYGVNINPSTFTKPPKGANDSGDLWRAKGSRSIFTNEPDDGDKLQTPIMKSLAEPSNRTIKARGLYKENIEFNITFQLNMFCNNKPELSSVDGGIGRRVRVIEWKMKFVDQEDYDVNNKYHIIKDGSMMKRIITPEIRDAFMRLLLDRWQNRVSKMTFIPVPKDIQEPSASYVADSNPVLGFVMSNLDITHNDKDCIYSNTLYNLFNNKNISQTRFKNDLLALGIVSKKKRNGLVYVGIKEKVIVEESEAEEE